MSDPGKILVLGTGRCGAAFVVQLLSRLDFDTGLIEHEGQWYRRTRPPALAAAAKFVPGLEPAPDGIQPVPLDGSANELAALPRVLRDPALTGRLEPLLASQRLRADHALVCVQEFPALFAGGTKLSELFPKGRKLVVPVLRALYDAVLVLGRHEVPITVLEAPRITHDMGHAFRRLGPLLPVEAAARFPIVFRGMPR